MISVGLNVPLYWKDPAWPRVIVVDGLEYRISKSKHRWRYARSYDGIQKGVYQRRRDYGIGMPRIEPLLEDAQQMCHPRCLPKHMRVAKGL